MKSWKLNFTMILDMVYSVPNIQYFKIGTSLPLSIQGTSAQFQFFTSYSGNAIVKNLAHYYHRRTPGLNVFLGVSGHLNFKVLWVIKLSDPC